MFDYIMGLPVEVAFFVTIANALFFIICGGLYLLAYERNKGRDGKIQSLGQLLSEIQIRAEEKKGIENWLGEQKDELLKIEAEREDQERLRLELAVLANGLADKAGELDAINQTLRATEEAEIRRKKELEEAKGLSEEISELKKQREIEEAKCNDLTKQVEGLLKKTTEFEEASKKLAESKVMLDALTSECAAKERIKTEQASELQSIQDNLSFLRKDLKDIESKNTEFANLTQRVIEEEIRLSSYSTAVSNAESRKLEIENEIKDIETKVRSWRSEFDLIEKEKKKLEQLEEDLESLKDECEGLQAKRAYLEAANKKLEGQNSGTDGSENAYNSLNIRPTCLAKDRFTGIRAPESEEQALDSVRKRLKERNLIFPWRVVKAFHTCLKVSDISSLTVLAGVSGTGKTRLPMEYANALGMYSLVMSVQPRWDSPQDMLGFFNFVEKRYEATELTQALVSMDEYNFQAADKVKDGMLLVLLDEMNLARVEYYFSEFLSKLELRRDVESNDNLSSRSNAEIVIDSGREDTRNGEAQKRRLWVSKNVLFVGTMNEDESTQTLSDKVLDRANVIRFGAPKLKEKETARSTNDRSQQLSAKEWASWYQKEFSDPNADATVRSWCKELNEVLERAGRPIGFRIQDSVLAYVRNYPGSNNWQDAFADQLEYKILPKIRGLNVEDEAVGNVIEAIKGITEKIKDQEFTEALEGAVERSKNSGSGTFVWQGIQRKE